MNIFLAPFKKYAVFSGRSTRAEYWGFVLSTVVVAFVILFPIFILINDTSEIIFTIYALLLLLPSVTVTVRRLHDTNRSGWFVLLNLIPIIGGFILFIFTVLDSQPGENKYGPNPKQIKMS